MSLLRGTVYDAMVSPQAITFWVIQALSSGINQAPECLGSLLRDGVLFMQDDRDRAVEAYRIALHHDCCCYEAFKHLSEHHLLTSDDEQTLIAEIEFGEETAWLELLYRARVNRYEAARTQGAAAAADSAMMTDEAAAAGPSVPPLVHLDALENNYNLGGNLDLMSHRAEVQYYSHDCR